MAKEVLLTQSGYDALVQELEYLKTEKRAELAEKIKVARGFGDLSENSEYDEAKNEQGLVEQRILELEATVKNAKIVNKDTMDKNTVGVGVHVIVVDEDGFEEAYDIVGSSTDKPVFQHGNSYSGMCYRTANLYGYSRREHSSCCLHNRYDGILRICYTTCNGYNRICHRLRLDNHHTVCQIRFPADGCRCSSGYIYGLPSGSNSNVIKNQNHPCGWFYFCINTVTYFVYTAYFFI